MFVFGCFFVVCLCGFRVRVSAVSYCAEFFMVCVCCLCFVSMVCLYFERQCCLCVWCFCFTAVYLFLGGVCVVEF